MTSELSAHLHFGHISAHEIFARLADQEGWSPEMLGPYQKGSRDGWWGMSPTAESFLDELVTWRELGYNMTCHHPQYDQFDSLPEWAPPGPYKNTRKILVLRSIHSKISRQALPHDRLWNAAQSQLRREGTIHNYLRMLWGKKILDMVSLPARSPAHNDRTE